MYQTEKASVGGTCPNDGRHTKVKFEGVRSVVKPRRI
jgi:hypothetical protein